MPLASAYAVRERFGAAAMRPGFRGHPAHGRGEKGRRLGGRSGDADRPARLLACDLPLQAAGALSPSPSSPRSWPSSWVAAWTLAGCDRGQELGQRIFPSCRYTPSARPVTFHSQFLTRPAQDAVLPFFTRSAVARRPAGCRVRGGWRSTGTGARTGPRASWPRPRRPRRPRTTAGRPTAFGLVCTTGCRPQGQRFYFRCGISQ